MRVRLLLAAVVVAALAIGSGGATASAEDSDVRPAFGDLSSPIRPGASLGGYCTFNWVFYDVVDAGAGQVPAAYIGTAGHCTDEVGERVKLGTGPEIGTVVYDSDKAASTVDFSLIRLDASRVATTNPTMLGWGGPSGFVTPAQVAVGDQVDVHGYGIVLGDLDQTRSRYGFLVGKTDDEYVADMPAVNGDSGSPLLHHSTGKALGIISRYGFFAVPPSTDTGPMMPWIFRELTEAGFNVTLATAQ